MKIVFLDAATLGEDVKDNIFDIFGKFGEVIINETTAPEDVESEIKDADIVAINKVKLFEGNLKNAKKLKIICIAATGYDNVDTVWCRKNNIAVCNVKGYSTRSVAQLTIAMALNLVNHMPEYTEYVKNMDYSRSGVANRLVPVYHEISEKIWGIVGYGNIGKQVGRVAEALGCKVIVNKRTPESGVECVELDYLCENADIISVHTPLTDETRGIIDRRRIGLMKKDAILINVARGAVVDEKALSDAIEKGRLGGIGIDVYSAEPMAIDHPFAKIANLPNVCLTPHNAWGAYEARIRCLEIMGDNIEKFLNGEIQNRVDLI